MSTLVCSRQSLSLATTTRLLLVLLVLLTFACRDAFIVTAFVPRAISTRNVRIQHDFRRRISLYSNKESQPNEGSKPICRLATRADSKLPTTQSMLPESLFHETNFLDKLDAYYHAQAHENVRRLRREEKVTPRQKGRDSRSYFDEKQEEKVVSTLRDSLEDSGFELLSRRDLDLCEALNAGYLLRLSILPDVKDLDPTIAKEFYPERFDVNGTALDPDELLFDGRVLVYWRGYSEEVTRGRLLLPKVDYLQASVVQRSAAWVKARIDEVEDEFLARVFRIVKATRRRLFRIYVSYIQESPVRSLAIRFIRFFLGDPRDYDYYNLQPYSSSSSSSQRRIKLSRYGGSKVRFVGSPNANDALNPFTICEVCDDEDKDNEENAVYAKMLPFNSTCNGIAERHLYEEVNKNELSCQYDEQKASNKPKDDQPPSMQLLERVSISNLVDFSSDSGRKKLFKNFFAESELVEPTYEEVVVVWRPLPEFPPTPPLVAPKFVREFADMFDIDGFEPSPIVEEKKVPKPRIEIRNFERVPMSNLPAVLPKTKLVFRPADAFLFDLVSFVTFCLVVSSIRLDNPRLDFLAIVSVSLWLIRTVLRYSNKLARYDLLVKNFLTSKLSYRNWGSLNYLSSEAGSQRAIRAALVHSWILKIFKRFRSSKDGECNGSQLLTRSTIQRDCKAGVNDLLGRSRQVEINGERAVRDLEDLKLVEFKDDALVAVQDDESSVEVVRNAWNDLLCGNSGNRSMSHSEASDGISSSVEKSSGVSPSTSTLVSKEATNGENNGFLYKRLFDQAGIIKQRLERNGNQDGNMFKCETSDTHTHTLRAQPRTVESIEASIGSSRSDKKWYF